MANCASATLLRIGFNQKFKWMIAIEWILLNLFIKLNYMKSKNRIKCRIQFTWTQANDELHGVDGCIPLYNEIKMLPTIPIVGSSIKYDEHEFIDIPNGWCDENT